MTTIIEAPFLYTQLTEAQAEELGANYVKSKDMYRLPLTLGVLEDVYQVHQEESILELHSKRTESRKRFLNSKTAEAPIEAYNQDLRPYQRTDVLALARLPHVALFNEPRCGKTPTILKMIQYEGHRKNVAVVPASLLKNWSNEVMKWIQHEPIIYKGTPKKREKILMDYIMREDGFLIMSKETMRTDIKNLQALDIDCLIVDEAHFLNNHKSTLSKAMFELGKKAKKRAALTGTPVRQSAHQVWGILHFLYPDRFPGYWQFIDRYFNKSSEFFGGYTIGKCKRPKEFREVMETISVQRKRSEVMKWLPPVSFETIELEMESKQRKAYDAMKNEFVYENVDAPSVLAQLTRLRQICTCPSTLGLDIPSVKEAALLEWLSDNFKTPVIIFSTFTSYLTKLQDTLHKAKFAVSMVTGETKDRQAEVDAFQSGVTNIFLGNIIAAGTGLTLDRAEVVIFLDRDFTPIHNEQAQDRLIPTDQSRVHPCTVIDMVVADSADQRITQLLQNKESLTAIVNHPNKLKELLK